MTRDAGRPEKGQRVPEEAHEGKRLTQEMFLSGLLGKSINVVTMDSKVLRGTLVSFDPFTLFLQQDVRLLMVPKHAIKYCYGGEE